MKNEVHKTIEKSYLRASGAAVATGFLGINLYPEHHGAYRLGQTGLFILSAVILSLLAFIVHKSVKDQRNDNQDGNEDAPVSDPNRLKRMFFIWSGFTVLLAVSLLRYPLMHYGEVNSFSTKDTVSIILGVGIIVATIIHVIKQLPNLKKI